MHRKFSWLRAEWLLLGAILLIAFIARIHRIYPLLTFTYDQGRDMYVLQQITRGDLTFIGPTTGLPGVFLGPYMYYLLLPGFILSNGSPFGVVIWQMSLIVLSFPFLYLILKPLVGKWWGLLGVFWLALTPGAIDQARMIWNPSLVVLTLLPSFYCLIASKENQRLLPISLFFFGLSLQTELAYTFFLAPLYAVWILTHFEIPGGILKQLPAWLKPKQPVYSWRIFILGVIAFSLTLVPQGLFELKNNFLITRSVLTEMGDVTKQVSYQQVWSQRPGEIWSEMVVTLGGYASGAAVLAAGSFAAALYVLIAYRKKPAAWLFSGYLLLPLIGFMFHRGNYGYFFDYYMTAHYLPAIAVIIFALAHSTKLYPKVALGTGLALLIWICFIFSNYAQVIYNIPLFKYTAAKEIQALNYAREVATTDTPALEVFVPNLIPVAYQYLSEWQSRTGQATPIDFGAKAHPEYILIYEPAIGDGSRVAFKQWYEGWKQNAVCDPPVTFGIITVERCQRSER